jgi:hypothetical protein
MTTSTKASKGPKLLEFTKEPALDLKASIVTMIREFVEGGLDDVSGVMIIARTGKEKNSDISWCGLDYDARIAVLEESKLYMITRQWGK